MNKLAVFLEGQTELIFMRRLLEEVAGQHNIGFVEAKYGTDNIIGLIATAPSGVEQYHALLYDCGNDTQVKSAILDNLPSLREAGYYLILGLVDLYPRSRAGLDELEAFQFTVPGDQRVEIVVAVMETEAWFIGEHNHFPKWNGKLTSQFIHGKLGIKLDGIDFEAIPHPSALLKQIYRLVGAKGYTKKRWLVTDVVYCLDMNYFYLEMATKSRSIAKLIGNIDSFIAA